MDTAQFVIGAIAVANLGVSCGLLVSVGYFLRRETKIDIFKALNDHNENLIEYDKTHSQRHAEIKELMQRLVPPSTEIGGPETVNQQSEVEAVDSGNGQAEETEDTAPNLPDATKPWEELSHKERMALVRAGIKKAEYEARLKNE
jgi:hypothetical protein